MSETVTMPQLGESVVEGTIAKWLKQPGDPVARYEMIVSVVTDKVDTEIPSPAEGTMGELIAAEGAVVAVGEPICTIVTEAGVAGSPGAASEPPVGSAAPEAAADSVTAAPSRSASPDIGFEGGSPPLDTGAGDGSEPASTGAGGGSRAPFPVAPGGSEKGAPGPPPSDAMPSVMGDATALPPPPPPPAGPPAGPSAAAPSSQGNGEAAGNAARLHLTPAVRMLARERGVNLLELTGSGFAGRITKRDVLDHVERRDDGGSGIVVAPVAAPPAPRALGGETLVPLTPIRRAIADHMVRSRQTSPHAWMMMEVDMSSVVQLRASRREEFKRNHGVGLTFLPFVARAVVEGLRRFPTLNSTWSDAGVVLKHDINLGIAIALEDNLIVPVIRNADRLTVTGLATSMGDLAERARTKRLKPDETQGGTFTLNNTGSLGTVMSQPIINQPQAAILAMDSIIKRPVVVAGASVRSGAGSVGGSDAIAVRSMMNLCISFDHRINDGLSATRFLKAVKETLETIDPAASLA